MRQITACLATAAIALGVASVASPAFAGDDLGSNPVTEFFDSLGFGAKEKPDIDYQERAPLVPPTSTAGLPAPQPKGAARAGVAWPNDPDVGRRAERKAEADRAPTEGRNYRMDRNSRLDPDEIGGGRRTAGASVADGPSAATVGDNAISRSSPEDMARRPKTAAATPVDGPRTKLTDPPPGYLVGNGVTAQPAPAQKPWYARMFGN